MIAWWNKNLVWFKSHVSLNLLKFRSTFDKASHPRWSFKWNNTFNSSRVKNIWNLFCKLIIFDSELVNNNWQFESYFQSKLWRWVEDTLSKRNEYLYRRNWIRNYVFCKSLNLNWKLSLQPIFKVKTFIHRSDIKLNIRGTFLCSFVLVL